ncbi:MAG: Hsp20 family protein [Aliifodinibius sp.]|nr:Hsp20/alpha crystallin family protein [Fodinibius sp.]NIV12296.1 Hsp20 family protein [Fodinibius sp.]NIY24303.1 Hsp20 family protein [Fodinibius sp.]
MLMRTNKFPTLFNDRGRNRNTNTLRFSDMLDEMMEDAFSRSKGTFIPELNVYETDKEFEITVALPGMSKDDINIGFENNTITISGERKLAEEDDTKYHRIESRFGKFERSLPLPNVIDEENISATYDNGVLTITVPKSKEKAGKKIEVN